MRDLVNQNPGLKDMLSEAGYATPILPDGTPNPISEYLIEPLGVGEQWGRTFKGMGDWVKRRGEPTMSGAGATFLGGATLPIWGPKLAQGAKWLGGKWTGMGAAGGADAKTVAKKGAKQVAKQTSGEGIKSMFSNLTARFGGLGGIREALIKKVGKGRALALMARLGLGGAGALTGIGTAAGLALTGATVFTIAKLLMGTPEEYKAANEQRLQAVQGAAGAAPNYGTHPTFKLPPTPYGQIAK